MKQKSLEYYLSLDWKPDTQTVRDEEDNYVRLTVPLLPDFAVYGESVPEVLARFPEALESHLAGYLKVGKVIPEPMQVDRIVTGPVADTASNARDGTNIDSGILVPA